MKNISKEKLTGIAGTLVFHGVLLVLLLLIVMDRPPMEPEAGLSVVMGDEFVMTEVKVAPQPPKPQVQPQPQPQKPSPDKPLITQNDEESMQVDSVKAAEKEKAKRLAEEAERKRLAEEAERKRREEEAMSKATNLMANAFGKGNSMSSKGESSGEKSAGNPDGQADSGAAEGSGFGSFDLEGRSIYGGGKLPLPAYNVQEEGRVVVTIVVNPDGQVISTAIHYRTNTSSQALRNAAINAAKRVRFNSIGGVNNQEGTITYYFKLK
jgi:TonB family protein